MAVPARSRAAVPPSAKRIPRSCSDVFRLWASVGLGVVLALAFELGVDGLEALGLRQVPEGEKYALEYDFGAQLIGWNTFALVYLVLGIRAFGGVDRAELVRRVRGSPLPGTALKRYLLAGGTGTVWAFLVSIFAFTTIVTAAQQRERSTGLVVGLIVLTVVTSWVTITFVFALHYARRDIEDGGLEFLGDEEAVFSDYVYLAIGCSATFGTTDTDIVTSAMRRTVSVHGVIAFFLNTVVVAVLLSLLV
jgi:uncharacterized membrane protein